VNSAQTVGTVNRFSLLSNLEVDSIILHGPYEQRKPSPLQTALDTKDHHNIGIKIPTIVNGRLNYKENRKQMLAKKKKIVCVAGSNLNTKEHKVKVLDDSHPKDTAARIDQFLTSKFEVSSWIKPGATMDELVGTMENDFKDLEKSDVIVINGGANDVNSRRSQTINAVGNMACFVQQYNNTNIIIVNIPHRYDLDRTSVINSEIQVFNRQILKVAKAYSHVTTVDTDLDRKFYTRHSLHLNKRGKEWLAKGLAIQINRLVDDYTKNAEIFNQHIMSIAKVNVVNTNYKTSSANNRCTPTPVYYLLQSFNRMLSNFKLMPLSTKDIRNIIKSINTKNSHGSEEVSTKLLQLSSPFILSPLTHICNNSLALGIFPDRLIYSEIKPLFKKGDKLNISNYRPISLLSSFSKVLEKAAYIQLYEHCRKHNILVDDQFGFRNKLTTTDAIFKLINEVQIALNEKIIVGGIFCDLEKALAV